MTETNLVQESGISILEKCQGPYTFGVPRIIKLYTFLWICEKCPILYVKVGKYQRPRT